MNVLQHSCCFFFLKLRLYEIESTKKCLHPSAAIRAVYAMDLHCIKIIRNGLGRIPHEIISFGFFPHSLQLCFQQTTTEMNNELCKLTAVITTTHSLDFN